MKPTLLKIAKECPTCIRTGDPFNSLSVALSSLRCLFSIDVAMGIFCYGFRSADKPIFHAMRLGAGRSEMSAAPSRSLGRLFECFEMIWTHQRGDPKTVKDDPEFAKCEFEDSLESRNVRFPPAPARSVEFRAHCSVLH